jgi:hypothetical protein
VKDGIDVGAHAHLRVDGNRDGSLGPQCCVTVKPPTARCIGPNID